MTRNADKKLGKRKGGTYGRTHGPSKGNSKRAANKGVRREAKKSLRLDFSSGRASDQVCRAVLCKALTDYARTDVMGLKRLALSMARAANTATVREKESR